MPATVAQLSTAFHQLPSITPTQSTHPHKLLWLTDDVTTVQYVLSDLMKVTLSQALHTDQITYWVSNTLGRPVRVTVSYR